MSQHSRSRALSAASSGSSRSRSVDRDAPPGYVTAHPPSYDAEGPSRLSSDHLERGLRAAADDLADGLKRKTEASLRRTLERIRLMVETLDLTPECTQMPASDEPQVQAVRSANKDTI